MKKTRHTYFYMVTISALYCLMLLLLHSRLQVDFCNTRNQKTHHISISTTRHDISNLILIKSHTSGRISDQVHFNKSLPCHQPPESKSFRFQTVTKNLFYAYTAYLDKRMKVTYVRIMSILIKGKKDNVNVFCTFKGDNQQELQVQAVKYEMCENHNKKYGGWIMSCPLPDYYKDPCHVTVRITDKSDSSLLSNNVTLNLIKLSPATSKVDYAVCIPPLFGEVNHSRLIEFMEFTRYFGAEKFIFYTNVIKNIRSIKALEYYANKSLATLIPWILPEEIKEGQIWYHGQLIAHNDCLYRSMSLTNNVAIQDIDELIVPHDGNTYWRETLSPLISGGVVGLGIKSAFYDTNVKGGIMAINSIKRTKVFSRFRTKVLVKPAAIFEVGIHHVSKPLQEEFKIISADTSKVYLHHYRTCLSNYGMNCKDWVLDETIKSNYGAVKTRVIEVNTIVSTMLNLDDNAQNITLS